MRAWEMFWTFWLLVSGAAFAIITVIVTLKGFGDVKRMLSGITKSHDDPES